MKRTAFISVLVAIPFIGPLLASRQGKQKIRVNAPELNRILPRVEYPFHPRSVVKKSEWKTRRDEATGVVVLHYYARFSEPIPERFGELPRYDPKSAFLVSDVNESSGEVAVFKFLSYRIVGELGDKLHLEHCVKNGLDIMGLPISGLPLRGTKIA